MLKIWGSLLLQKKKVSLGRWSPPEVVFWEVSWTNRILVSFSSFSTLCSTKTVTIILNHYPYVILFSDTADRAVPAPPAADQGWYVLSVCSFIVFLPIVFLPILNSKTNMQGCWRELIDWSPPLARAICATTSLASLKALRPVSEAASTLTGDSPPASSHDSANVRFSEDTKVNNGSYQTAVSNPSVANATLGSAAPTMSTETSGSTMAPITDEEASEESGVWTMRLIVTYCSSLCTRHLV